jgi:hypothetical protein
MSLSTILESPGEVGEGWEDDEEFGADEEELDLDDYDEGLEEEDGDEEDI